MKNELIASTRANIVGQYVNLKKDYFSLTPEEFDKITLYKKVFNFNGKNNLGRSEHRQFYYHLQEGHRINIEKALKTTNPYK